MTASTGPNARSHRYYRGWIAVAVVLAVAAIVPYIPILRGVFRGGDAWTHVQQNVLARYTFNSIAVLAGTIAGAGIIGTFSAWVLYRYRIPGRSLLEILVLTPIALPAYISTFTWNGIVSYGGVVQRTFGITLPFAGIPAVIFVLTFGLYPYVYLTVRSALHSDSRSLFEVVASLSDLGLQRRIDYARRLARGVLPTLRPAIVGGLALVGMEVMNAYATPVYLGVETLSTGVFRTWFSLGDLRSATRLASIALVMVLLLLSLERLGRGRKRYSSDSGGAPLVPRNTTPVIGTLLVILVAIPPTLGFLIPFAQLLSWSLLGGFWVGDIIVTTARTVILALAATTVVVVIALLINFTAYLKPGKFLSTLRTITGIGYAVPGTVMAIGVLGVFRAMRLVDERLFVFGTIGGLIYAYTARYLAIALQPIRGAFERNHRSVVDAARSLGSPPSRVLGRIVLPIFRPTLAASALLVAIDVIKDIPITLLLRPFDFSTLAIEVYRLAGDERLPEAAPRALLLVTIGILTIFVIMRSSTSRRREGR